MSSTIRDRSPRALFFNIIKFALLIFWALTTILPLLWVMINSLKPTNDILKNSISLPSSFDLSNFITIMNYPDVNMARAFLNSFIISGSTVVFVLIFAGMASFALGRFRMKSNAAIMAILSACLMVPSFATVIPNFVTMSKIPFVRGSYPAAIIPQTAGNLCFSIIMLTGFMRSLPTELDEAAVIDGASILQIFMKISMPLCKSMLSTISIMVFIWSYNDLFTSLVYISEQAKKPVCVILSMVSNMYGTDYGAMMAAIVVTIAPLLILYVCASEQVVNGLTAGAVKG